MKQLLTSLIILNALGSLQAPPPSTRMHQENNSLGLAENDFFFVPADPELSWEVKPTNDGPLQHIIVDIPHLMEPLLPELNILDMPSFYVLVQDRLQKREYGFINRQIQQYGAEKVCNAYHSDEKLLHFAAQTNHHPVVEMLCKGGINPNIVNGRLQETALHRAVLYGSYNSVVTLLEYNASTEILDGEGETPLFKLKKIYSNTPHVAINLAKLLLRHKAQADKKSLNKYQQTPLHCYARGAGYPELVKLFIENGASLFARDAEGKTAHQVTINPAIRKMLTVAAKNTLKDHFPSASIMLDKLSIR